MQLWGTDLNGIIDLLYSLITLGISRPDGGFSLSTGLRNPLLGERPISSQLISDKPMEFHVAPRPFIPPYVHSLTQVKKKKRERRRSRETDPERGVCACVRVCGACARCFCTRTNRCIFFLIPACVHVHLCMYVDVCAIVYVPL